MILYDLSGRRRYHSTQLAYLRVPGTIVVFFSAKMDSNEIKSEMGYWMSMVDQNKSSIIIVGTSCGSMEQNSFHKRITSACASHHVVKIIMLDLYNMDQSKAFTAFIKLLNTRNKDSSHSSGSVPKLCSQLYNCIQLMHPVPSAINVTEFISSLQAKSYSSACHQIVTRHLRIISEKGFIILSDGNYA